MMSFREFWLRYLRAHQHRGTRVSHYYATGIALSAVTASVLLHSIWVTMLGIVIGYAIALTSHRVDHSKSLVLVNPVWGARADFKMCWLALTGGLSAELAQHVGGPRDHASASMVQSSQ